MVGVEFPIGAWLPKRPCCLLDKGLNLSVRMDKNSPRRVWKHGGGSVPSVDYSQVSMSLHVWPRGHVPMDAGTSSVEVKRDGTQRNWPVCPFEPTVAFLAGALTSGVASHPSPS